MVQEEVTLYGLTLQEFYDLFYLSPDSPSGLRWKKTVCSTAVADSVAGSFSETVPFPLWRTKFNRVGMIVSRILWFMHYKEVPDVIDHKDGDPKNNQIVNLRNVRVKVNCENRKVINDTGHAGVYLIRGGMSWRCQGTKANGERWAKCFGVKKYGFDGAKDLCLAYRKKHESENCVQTREVTLNDIR